MFRAIPSRVFSFLALALLTFPTLAHQTSDAYFSLQLTNSQFVGRLSVALRDLNHVLMFDSDNDGEIADEELERAKPNIERYVFDRIKISTDSKTIPFLPQPHEIQQNDTAIYVTLPFRLEPEQIGPDLLVEYSLFSDTDPLHRGLFRLDLPEPAKVQTYIFGPSSPSHRFLLNASAAAARTEAAGAFLNFLREGVWHIWIGFDHILFLLALLLPAVLVRQNASWIPTDNLRATLMNVFKIVTAFTIAHSITLTLATLNIVQLPGRFIESVIAASVLLAAINNVKAIFPERTWIIAFAFGLVHGFGFASVLGELDLPANALALALFGFNLGVEVGQLAIVLVFVPIAYVSRTSEFYQHFAVRYGSVAIAVLATTWMFERLLDKKILPF